MKTVSIDTARQRRDKAARAAQHLNKVSKRVAITPEHLSREQLCELPAWCALELGEIRHLQRTCGALYFAPLIALSIDGRLLREFRDFTGARCFSYVRNNSEATHSVTVDINDRKLPIALMAAGSGVLLSSLDDQYLIDLFEHLIGPRSLKVDAELAQNIIREADFLLRESTAIATGQ